MPYHPAMNCELANHKHTFTGSKSVENMSTLMSCKLDNGGGIALKRSKILNFNFTFPVWQIEVITVLYVNDLAC